MAQRRQSSGATAVPRSPAETQILVLDRDLVSAGTISAILRADGFAVHMAASRVDALEMFTHSRVDVVLVDVQPGSDGRDTLADVRALAPSASVLVLAGYASLDTALSALRAGAYDYLVKPVDIEELRLAVGRAAERRQLERELAARVAELEAAHAEERTFNARLRRQIEEATTELRAKVAALDEANQQLRDAQEQHDRFVAMVAHEMRGPLNPIINYAHLAKRPGTAPETRDRYMDIIVEHAFRLNRLVDDLQTATRLSAGQFTLRRERCDVASTVAELVDQFTASVRERVFVLEGTDAPISAEVDRDRLTQAVRNLIDNAVKYSAENGAIEVKVSHTATDVSISVGDYGAGIPDEEMRRIFDAFTRLGHKSDVAGTGLGLYITRGIVSAHGGTLSVANREGDERARGAIFTITLPLTASASAPADA